MGRDKIHGQSLLKDAIQSPNHQESYMPLLIIRSHYGFINSY